MRILYYVENNRGLKYGESSLNLEQLHMTIDDNKIVERERGKRMKGTDARKSVR